jgi:hypothetical protein
VTQPFRNPDLTVARIDQPRGDGMGRALVVESKSWQVSVLLDDPEELRALIDELQSGLDWLAEPPP